MEKAVSLFVGLGQETRLRILEQLADGGTLTPNELAERLGLTQQNVSKPGQPPQAVSDFCRWSSRLRRSDPDRWA